MATAVLAVRRMGIGGRPTTGLGMFLRALGGTGLLHQSQSYTAPDEDECWTDEEARDAAVLLRAEQNLDGDDDEEAEGGSSVRDAREDAEHLWGLIFSHWRGAGRSLYRAQAVLAPFPWLEEWAKPSLTAKMRYLETLRAQAARFANPGFRAPERHARHRTPCSLFSGRMCRQKG
ncbi:hypothetical protein JIX56_04065 [Streptomyces sp. CA-210063]|uniref:hypothetical protein n=1 Tax=Streptomyces sp. CA-210063 TaxID=2801029 RepID=UPI00214AF951|nr:hypothetical protein [Streptomyces sp. CA-210063]UUU29141.1 hypothetical protein JIX56_04065 [Streptomyces sp. CA-210063]